MNGPIGKPTPSIDGVQKGLCDIITEIGEKVNLKTLKKSYKKMNGLL